MPPNWRSSRLRFSDALWLVCGAICVYTLAYRFYAQFIADRVLRLDAARRTPAHRPHADHADVDFVAGRARSEEAARKDERTGGKRGGKDAGAFDEVAPGELWIALISHKVECGEWSVSGKSCLVGKLASRVDA